jgi:hypothetical protein
VTAALNRGEAVALFDLQSRRLEIRDRYQYVIELHLNERGGRSAREDQSLPTAMVASFSIPVVSGAGVRAMNMTTFDLKTKMTAPLPPLLVLLYSTALSPIPVTDLAFVIPYAPFSDAAIVAGETALALLVSG